MRKMHARFLLAALVGLVFGMVFCMNKVFWADVSSTQRWIYATISILLYVLILFLPFIALRLRGKCIAIGDYIRSLFQ